MTLVHDLIVVPPVKPLFGSVPVPADSAIGTLCLLGAALADGTSEVSRLSGGPDETAMLDALAALGVAIDFESRTIARVHGVGLDGLLEPRAPVDCGGSARTMRLLAGALAHRRFETVLRGDVALSGTRMVGLVDALRRRGAVIEGTFSSTESGLVTPPLAVGPLGDRQCLSGGEHELVSRVFDVKEALLLSGLSADEATYIRERIVSPDHAERLLQALDVPVAMVGPIVCLEVESWARRLPAFAAEIPGDFWATALLMAAATVVPGSRVCARETNLNPTRTGALDHLRRMGGVVEAEVHRSALGEPEGTVCASYASLVGNAVSGEALLRSSEELPLLVALSARARGVSELSDLRSLDGGDGSRKAEQRIARLADVVRAFGIEIATAGDALVIEGRPDGPLSAVDVDAEGDAGVAAAATVLGLVGRGPSRIRGVDALAVRFPRFVGTLRALGVEARVEERSV